MNTLSSCLQNPILNHKRNIFRLTLFLLLFIQNITVLAYCPDRTIFPAICDEHFNNNVTTEHTWMAAEDKNTISEFLNFLDFIPRLYDPDCIKCVCGGLKLDLHSGCFGGNSEPTNKALNQIHAAHRYVRPLQSYCPLSMNKSCADREGFEYSCWDGGYFRKWNHKYIHFFKHFLLYCSDNTCCSCFWPEMNKTALICNNRVYWLLENLADEEQITPDFSEHWKAHTINWFDLKKGRFLDKEYYPNSQGIASSLTTYTFFYSQYHQMLLSVMTFIDSNMVYNETDGISQIYEELQNLATDFQKLYTTCLKTHPHPKIYYERGMVRLHLGETKMALDDLECLIDLSNSSEYKEHNILTSEMFNQEGQAYADLGMYDKAITALTEAIRRDPNNKDAYLHRAGAHFETKNFDNALSDYQQTEPGKKAPQDLKVSTKFHDALLCGLLEGSSEAVINFVPSLCNTASGMGETLWAFCTEPITSTRNFANACYAIGECTYDFLEEMDWDQIEEFSDELKRLYANFDSLNDNEKGRVIGLTIGKYGVDIYASIGAIKGMAYFRNLKEANMLCTLEAMATSNANKEAIISSALKHSTNRELFFKNVKIHIDKQNKHVVGAHNYQKGKSIFEHKDPQALIEKFAGKGTPTKNSVPGSLNYREVVDFGEFIGYHVDLMTQKQTATTIGVIHYSKTGAHIVPMLPK